MKVPRPTSPSQEQNLRGEKSSNVCIFVLVLALRFLCIHVCLFVYTGRDVPRPRHFTLDVVTWTRLVFKRPALTSEGEEKLRSKESPPPSPRILSQEPGYGTISEEHLGREEGVEMKEMKVVLPPPDALESPLPTADLDIILPPPVNFLEDHPSTEMQTSQEQTTSFGPFGPRSNEHRAQSLPPMPTPPMDTSSRVEQGITLTLPSVAGKYGYPPPK